MHSVVVGNKTLLLPVLVPSISSFETQLDPYSALQLQYQLREPVSLVSSFDLSGAGSKFLELCKQYQSSAVLLLDSGGYEASHSARYARDRGVSWSFDQFRAACLLQMYDFAFSFDYFWRDAENISETPEEFIDRLIDQLTSHLEFIDREKLIPVVHLHAKNDERTRLTEEEVQILIATVAQKTCAQFIAVPERELGDGLVERFNRARSICKTLADASPEAGLHVLGCGNLLSFAYLAAAGVAMADGLEWYRTYAADNYHLHHFHHGPLFESASTAVLNPVADWILNNDLPYRVKTVTRNLVSYQAFQDRLHSSLEAGNVHELVRECFGKKASALLRELEQ